MRVLRIDEREGVVELLLEVPEDMYYVSLILERGDRVYAWSLRQLRVGSSGERGDRVRVYLGIELEKISYAKFSNKIRLTGRIVEAPDSVGGRGSYHTLSLGVGDSLKVVKRRGLDAYTREMLSRAASAIKRVLVVSVGDEEIAVGVLSPVGIDIRAVRPLVSSKTGREESLREQVFPALKRELEQLFLEYLKAGFDEILILTTERLIHMIQDFIKERQINAKVIRVSEGGEAGIYEVLRREDLEDLFAEVRRSREREAVETVLRLLAQGSRRVVLGLSEALEAARWGVVRELLLVDELLWDEDLRSKVIEVFNAVVENSGRVIVVPSESESGAILKKLGGAAAILHYDLPSAR